MKEINEKYDDIIARLNVIEKLLVLTQKQIKDPFLDNSEFIRVMGISARTAQNWRDAGVISFSQIGIKIYYKMSDIIAMLDKHYKKSI